MKLKNLLSYSGLLLAFPFLNSCVSTEVIEPADNEQPTQELVINLSAPADAKTRAEDGYKLRYIAKIFKGASSNSWGNKAIARKEVIDGEVANNKMVFQVEPNQDYGIMVFADYIPSSYQPNESGLYTDYFYNTKNVDSDRRHTIRTTPGSDDQKVSADFFNNENYDSFFAFEQKYKGEEELIVPMTLTRATAKVIFQNNTSTTGDCKVAITQLTYSRHYDMDKDPTCFTNQLNPQNLTLPEASITEDNKDLFYFYTFAEKSNQKLSVFFDVTDSDSEKRNYQVSDIPIKPNFKTIVKGAYLPEILPEPQYGDLILHPSTNYSWEQESLEK